MEYRYILIEEENEKDFASVLPPGIMQGVNRISIGAINENYAVVGAISYFLVRYEYVIDWVFVAPSVRRQRIGSQLVNKVIETILRMGDLFPIVARFPYTDREHDIFSLFQSLERMTTSYSHERFVISREGIANAAPLQMKLNRKTGKKMEEKFFFDLPEKEQMQILMEMRIEHGFVIKHPESLRDSMVPALCRCTYDDGALVDLVLIQKLLKGDLEVSFVYSKNPIGLITTLISITAEAQKTFPNASLTFDAVNEKSLQLAGKLFPGAVSMPIFEAVYL